MNKKQQSYNSTLKKQTEKQAAKNKAWREIPPPADGLCQKCRAFPDWRGLARHHVSFRSQGGSYTKDNCAFLCGKCHSLEHGTREG